jgi:hypothetical protein
MALPSTECFLGLDLRDQISFIYEALRNASGADMLPTPECFKGEDQRQQITDIYAAISAIAAAEQGGIELKSQDGTSDFFTPDADTDAARGAALEEAWAEMETGDEMIIGPGVYMISSRLPLDVSNVNIHGSGKDQTTIVLSDLGAGQVSRNVVGTDLGPGFATPRSGISISDITFDCGLDAQTSSIASGAVLLQGSDMSIRRCRGINWGTKSTDECFVFVINSHYNTTLFDSGALIEDCIVDQPANVVMAGVVTAFDISGGGMSGAGITDPFSHGWLHDGTIRGCSTRGIVTGLLQGQVPEIHGYTMMTYGGRVTGNIFQDISGTGAARSFYSDTWSAYDISISGNSFESAPIYTSISSFSLQNVRIVDNAVLGIVIIGNAGFKTKNVLIQANRVDGRIYLEQVDGSLVSGNTITRVPESDGVNIATGTVNVRQFGNFNDAGLISGVPNPDSAGVIGTVAFVTSTQSVTNSATLTDSTEAQLILSPGVYEVETEEFIGSSDFTNAGSKSAVTFTGTLTVNSSSVDRANVAGSVPLNVAPTWDGGGFGLTSVIGANGFSFHNARKGKITVTVGGTLKIQFAQNTAVALQTATLIAGSYIKATRTG